MNKKAKKRILILMVSGIFLTGLGCVHSAHSRGSVVLKHSAIEADVCLGSKEVKPGEKVMLFKNECRETRGSHDTERTSCKKIKVGNGEIISNLDEHYSTMRVEPEVSIVEGMTVEK